MTLQYEGRRTCIALLGVHLNVVSRAIMPTGALPVKSARTCEATATTRYHVPICFASHAETHCGKHAPRKPHNPHPSTVPAEWRAPSDTIEAPALAHWALVNTNFLRPLFHCQKCVILGVIL